MSWTATRSASAELGWAEVVVPRCLPAPGPRWRRPAARGRTAGAVVTGAPVGAGAGADVDGVGAVVLGSVVATAVVDEVGGTVTRGVVAPVLVPGEPGTDSGLATGRVPAPVVPGAAVAARAAEPAREGGRTGA
ncbi:MAG TPA: hypothetical protein VMB72_11515, partial [Acidimicrobiales bacterium]|nr:hypothetical protein [Acidimicrobiales bacterium]